MLTTLFPRQHRVIDLSQNIFFIIHFYAIKHRTTIVQNKIISTICFRYFFSPANIYRPSLGKVPLGRPNPKPIQPLNFYLRRKRKKKFTQNCMHYNRLKPDFHFHLLSFFFFLYQKTCQNF